MQSRLITKKDAHSLSQAVQDQLALFVGEISVTSYFIRTSKDGVRYSSVSGTTWGTDGTDLFDPDD